MQRSEQLKIRNNILSVIKLIVSEHHRYSTPSYKKVTATLNIQQVQTTWGNDWTPQRLLRFLQRLGYSGLHGVQSELNGLPKKLD